MLRSPASMPPITPWITRTGRPRPAVGVLDHPIRRHPVSIRRRKGRAAQTAALATGGVAGMPRGYVGMILMALPNSVLRVSCSARLVAVR